MCVTVRTSPLLVRTSSHYFLDRCEPTTPSSFHNKQVGNEVRTLTGNCHTEIKAEVTLIRGPRTFEPESTWVKKKEAKGLAPGKKMGSQKGPSKVQKEKMLRSGHFCRRPGNNPQLSRRCRPSLHSLTPRRVGQETRKPSPAQAAGPGQRAEGSGLASTVSVRPTSPRAEQPEEAADI